MQLHRFGDIKEFCDRTQAYLLQHEAEHNLLLGITEKRAEAPGFRHEEVSDSRL